MLRIGYIPWPDAYDEGGYEVETTPYAPEAASRVVEAAMRALGALHTG